MTLEYVIDRMKGAMIVHAKYYFRQRNRELTCNAPIEKVGSAEHHAELVDIYAYVIECLKKKGEEHTMEKIIENIEAGIKGGLEKTRLNSELSDLLSAAIELISVANRRGDDELPNPANDDKLWTARMQTAWDRLYASVEYNAPGAIAKEQKSMQEWESDIFAPKSINK